MMQASVEDQVVFIREQELDFNDTPRVTVDPVAGVMNAFINFGAANLPINLFTLPTGAVRCRIVGIYGYGTGAMTISILDNITAVFPKINLTDAGNFTVSKDQLGEGGIIITSTLGCFVDPSANGCEIFLAYIPEYDDTE